MNKAKSACKAAKDSSGYLRKASRMKNIQDISGVFKQYLKEFYRMPLSLTLEEIAQKISRKRLDQSVKQRISAICLAIEEQLYKHHAANAAKIGDIRKSVCDIMKQHVREQPKKKKPFLSWFFDKQLHKKLTNAKATIGKERLLAVEQKIQKKNMGKEERQLIHFISVAKGAGMSKAGIQKELQRMGFEKERISSAIKACSS